MMNHDEYTHLFMAMPEIDYGCDIHHLYRSETDGLSFSRLVASVMGYGGPVLLLVESEQMQVGVLIPEQLEDSA